MKKSSIVALVCALFLGQNVMAQNTNEITYVEDASQGYLFNRFRDNWFITAEGGANIYFSPSDSKRSLSDRFAPAASLYVGKWFSPLLGIRMGASYMDTKGVANTPNSYGLVWDGFAGPEMYNDAYKTNVSHIGFNGDVMLNLTNWWCGYKPSRIYNLTAYLGGAYYWTFVQKGKVVNDVVERDGWEKGPNTAVALRGGIINSFNVSKQVQLSLDLRYSCMVGHADGGNDAGSRHNNDLAAFLGVTYLFPNRTWNAPVVPVCPEPENCDALRARLAAADSRIADLENQLRECLDRPVTEKVVEEGPMTTIYFPIGVSRLTRIDNNVLKAIGNVMQSNPDQKYVITGWADNYTGTDAINTRLRNARAESVKKVLVRSA